ncbi:MAG: hypothetical protein J6Y37_06010 [Paludibacteraceae bacterium]|nr:hypothetical protein [Paludibacteraceae bacterium]
MKEIFEMTDEELVNYYREKRLNGYSTREVLNSINSQPLSDEQRKLVAESLVQLDKEIKLQKEQEQKKAKRIRGLCELIAGVLVFLFGCLLYHNSAKANVVFLFNYVVWGAGILLVFAGIIEVIVGSKKS